MLNVSKEERDMSMITNFVPACEEEGKKDASTPYSYSQKRGRSDRNRN